METNNTPASVTDTIIAQLGGARIFAMAFDARRSMAREDSITLRIAASLVKSTKGRATHVRVTLDASDTYKVEALQVGKLDAIGTTVAEFEGVYADMLKSIVEGMTGLYLSL